MVDEARERRLAIYVRNPPAYSETFLDAQINALQPKLLLSGLPFATTAEPGGEFYPPKSIGGAATMLWARGIRRRSAEFVQALLTREQMRSNKINLLLANYGQEGVKFLSVCQGLQIPLLTHFHGIDAHAFAIQQEFKEQFPLLGMGGNRVVVVSEVMRETLCSLGVPENAIFLIRYGIELEKFEPLKEFSCNPVFLAVGRFVDKKAPYLTLLAFKKASERILNAKLKFIGSGELLETTINICKHIGIENSVEFLGSISPQEVAKQMRHATAFVQHSITPDHGPFAGDKEGTPVAVLEAMMVGLPIIASRHAGIGEVIEDGRTGLLFEERDVDAMAQAMVDVASDRSLCARLGAAARAEAINKYSAEAHATALKKCLDTTYAEWTTCQK